MQQRYLTTTLHATMHGEAWGGFTAQLPLTLTLSREDRNHRPLATMLAAALRAKGGDFQSVKLTADSYARIRCTRISGGRVRTLQRDVPLARFRSAAPFIDADAFTLDDD